MVKISIKYVHKYRSPYSYVNEQGELINAYGVEFFPSVNLAYHGKLWKIDLPHPPQC